MSGACASAASVTSQDLVVSLERTLPAALEVGSAGAIFCLGRCHHRSQAIRRLDLVLDGERHPATAFGMPRPDAGGDRRAYLSGFWATVPVAVPRRPGRLELKVSALLASGVRIDADLGAIEVVEPHARQPPAPLPADLPEDAIAICMGTYEPDVALLRRQITSIQDQSDTHWICLISDDCSSPQSFEQLLSVIGEDHRFVVSRSPERLGFYRNFERALRMVPPSIELVALSDQDDRWDPEKLSTLRAVLGRAELAYCNQRLADADGRVLRATLWHGRRTNPRNLASQVVANTITGAAMLMRREVVELALPFPEGPGFLFHDHWIGMVAMAAGRVEFVPQALYDYVQHRGAVFGDVSVGRGSRPAAPESSLLDRWRAAYFYGYVSRELQARTVLERCGDRLTPRNRHALSWFIASDRSMLALAWLAARSLRAAVGLNETLGSEADLVRGILWRRLLALLTPRSRRVLESRLPDPAIFEQRRLRRWRARV